MTTLAKPRFEARALPADQVQGRLTWGLFDTFTQEFIVGHPMSAMSAAALARKVNREYGDA